MHFGIQHSKTQKRQSYTKPMKIKFVVIFQMSCVLFLVVACLVCGMLFQTYRVKLKTRYTLCFAVVVVLFCIYSEFQVCGNPAYREDLIGKDKVINLRKTVFETEKSLVIKQDFDQEKRLQKTNLTNMRKANLFRENNKAEEVAKLPEISHGLVKVNKDTAKERRNESNVNNNGIRKDVTNNKQIERNENLSKKISKNLIKNSKNHNGILEETNVKNENGYDDDVTADNDGEETEDINDLERFSESPRFNKSFDQNLSKLFLEKFSGRSQNFLYENKMDESEKKKYFFDFRKKKKLLPHFTPQKIKEKMQHFLPWWELEEMMNYPRIWYVGENAKTKLVINKTNPHNFGFDKFKDLEGGIYKITQGDHLEYRYEIMKRLGSGSFGSVVLARDHALKSHDPNRMVAVKVMHNDSTTEKYFKKEIDLMRMIFEKTLGSERFSTVLRTFFFRNHLCYVMELLNSTLEESRNDQPVVNLPLLKKYTIDILKGLSLLHKENIIHGDLKPENLMFVPQCNVSCRTYIKIVDFSLSCIPDSEDYECPGTHFQTRLYRAPEVVMNLDYTVTADMWSVGVILTELYMNKVPFYGESSTDQLAAIMEVMGLLPPYMVETSPDIKTYQKAVCYTCKNGFKRVPYRKSLSGVLKDMPGDLFDFIKRCFELDYRKRMTSLEGLKHRFLTES